MSRVRGLVSAVAFLLPLAVYVRTLAREVTFVDSGELTAAAATLGIAHPPGYPLFTLLGHLLSWLPVGSVVFRVGLLSAVAAAAASWLIYHTGCLLLSHLQGEPAAGMRRHGDNSTPDLRGVSLAIAPLAGALHFAFARTVWQEAVIVEVYTLQALLISLLLYVYARALSRRDAACVHWPAAAFCFGLAMTNHLTSALLGLSLLLFLLISLRGRQIALKRSQIPWWRTVALGFLPLTLYVYLPLRSRMNPLLSWNDPETWHRFWVHVTARQYHGHLGREGFQIQKLGDFFVNQLPQEAGWVFVLLAALGLGAALWKSWRWGLLSLSAVVPLLLYNLLYPIHDIALYYGPVLAIFGLWAALGAGAICWSLRRLHRGIAAAAAACLVLSCLMPLDRNFARSDQRDFRLLGQYVRDGLRSAETGGIVFSGNSDYFSSPALYLQHVEGVRPDVLVLDAGRLASPVLDRFLARHRPELAEACAVELQAVVPFALAAERGKAYDVQEARRRYAELRRALVRAAFSLRPTYVVGDLRKHFMFAGFHLVPEGLLFRLADSEAYHPYPLPAFTGPTVARSHLRDRHELAIFNEYLRMLNQRVKYLQQLGHDAEADSISNLAGRLPR